MYLGWSFFFNFDPFETFGKYHNEDHLAKYYLDFKALVQKELLFKIFFNI